MGALAVTLLGGLEVRVPGGAALGLADPAVRALLAYLASTPGHRHPPAALASLLWPGVEDSQARRNLDLALGALRAALAGAHVREALLEGEGIGLDAEVDAAAFEQAVAEGTPAALARAAALYRGDFLRGVTAPSPAFEAWTAARRERLRALALDGLYRLLELQTAAGDLAAAVATAQQVLALDPRQEAAHRALMRLHVRQGHPGRALRQYQTLQEATGGRPGEESRALYHEVLAGIFQGPPPPAGERRVILVVEDDPPSRATIAEILGRAGYEVVCAEDGADALLQLGRRRFDLVLSDVGMPTLNGVQLLEIMHRHRLDTPVLFVTGFSVAEVQARGLALTERDYVQKPFRQAVLLERVRAALSR